MSPFPLFLLRNVDVSVSLDLRRTWNPQPTYDGHGEWARDRPLLWRPLRCWNLVRAARPSLSWGIRQSTMQTAMYPSVKPLAGLGDGWRKWENIKVRGKWTRNVDQDLEDMGERDGHVMYPGGRRLHHMCQWLPLEFSNAQPERWQAAALPFLAPLFFRIEPDLQDVAGTEFTAPLMSTCPAPQAGPLKTSGMIPRRMQWVLWSGIKINLRWQNTATRCT